MELVGIPRFRLQLGRSDRGIHERSSRSTSPACTLLPTHHHVHSYTRWRRRLWLTIRMSTGGTGRPRRLRRTTRYWACQVPSPPWLLLSDPPRRQRSLRPRPRRISRLIVRQPMHYCITAYTDPSWQERAPVSRSHSRHIPRRNGHSLFPTRIVWEALSRAEGEEDLAYRAVANVGRSLAGRACRREGASGGVSRSNTGLRERTSPNASISSSAVRQLGIVLKLHRSCITANDVSERPINIPNGSLPCSRAKHDTGQAGPPVCSIVRVPRCHGECVDSEKRYRTLQRVGSRSTGL
jgi:hypothetical protein